MPTELTGEELLAFRAERGISRHDLALALGYSSKTIANFEQGRAPVSEKFATKFIDFVGNGGMAGTEPPLPPLEEVLPEGDLPPFAETPAPDFGGDDTLALDGLGGRAVSVRSLGHFQRIQLSLYVALVGKDISYVYPDPAKPGKRLQGSVHQQGLADFLSPKDGAVVREYAAELAAAWVEWARTNSRVNTFLGFLIVEGGFKGVALVSGKVTLMILRNHGVDPLAFLFGPLGGPPKPAVQSREEIDDGLDYFPPDMAQASGNGDGAAADAGAGLGPYGFRTVEGGVGFDAPPPDAA